MFFVMYYQTRDSTLWSDGLYQMVVFLDDCPFKETLRLQYDFETDSEIIREGLEIKAKTDQCECRTDAEYIVTALEIYNGINKFQNHNIDCLV